MIKPIEFDYFDWALAEEAWKLTNGHVTSQVESRLLVLGWRGIWEQVKDEVLAAIVESIFYENI